MNRIPFSQVLKNASIDLRREYDRLYLLFYIQKIQNGNGGFITLRDCCVANFVNFSFRGTCISMKDFDDFYGFHFEKVPSDFDINYLVSFCEYSCNFAFNNQGQVSSLFMMEMNRAIQFYIQQVMTVIEAIGYMQATQNGITNFVPKDQTVISVAEIIDPTLSYKVIEYNHHSMKGDLERKKSILLALADKLEPQREKLKNVNSSLETDLFFLLNSVNLRHNNSDPNGKKYIPTVSSMENSELEQWYDDTYQMCLLAFLELDHIERKSRINALKKDIESKKQL